MGKKLLNQRLSKEAAASSSAAAAAAATTPTAAATAVIWLIYNVAGEYECLYEPKSESDGRLELNSLKVYDHVAAFCGCPRHSLNLIHEGRELLAMSVEDLQAIDGPITVVKQPRPWWLMNKHIRMNQVLALCVGMTGSVHIHELCKYQLPNSIVDFVRLSPRQLYFRLFGIHNASGYIEQARIMKLHALMSSDGVIDDYQLDIFDMINILRQMSRDNSVQFLLALHHADGIDLDDDTQRWSQLSRHYGLPFRPRAPGLERSET